MTPDDLRAGVQAGILSEAQAASLSSLIQARAGLRETMPEEDEPFEFFRGFSEIFITIGMMILLGGVLATIFWVGGGMIAFFLPLIAAAVAWFWAIYFTLMRRMNLPSMLLASVYGFGVMGAVTAAIIFNAPHRPSSNLMALAPFVATLAMGLWYRFFRLPFSMFLLGGFALMTGYTLTVPGASFLHLWHINTLFDLSRNPVFALVTFGFGIVAFLAGMWFDMRDPHRLGRNAATAFWLHLLAAFALVNTVAVTFYGQGGIALLTLALLIITVMALVIDRRSFVSAAIGYMAFVVIWVMGSEDFGSWAFTLIVLGALITAIGTWWVQLRGLLMNALPDFPGKDRLPPYTR